MSRTDAQIQFLEGIYNKIPNRTIARLIVGNMREIGLPTYDNEDLEFAQKVAKTISKDTKSAQLRKSKRPRWEELLDRLIDDEIPDPWGEGETIHGSTDVGDVSWQVPTVEFGTATWVLGTPAHSWQAVTQSSLGIGHKSLVFAAKTMATTVLDLLLKKADLKKAQLEHKQRTRSKKYKSPIPKDHKPPLNPWK
jgi:aminobenzoyl-glutamate utilization protein B